MDAAAPLMRVYVQNMAGDVLALDMPVEASVAALKQRIRERNGADCAIGRQRLFIEAASDAHTVLDDAAATLASYGVGDQATVHLFVANRARGEYIRTIGSGKAGSEVGEFKDPRGLALLGSHLFVSEYGNHRVQVFDVETGAHLNTIGTFGSGDAQLNTPRGICVSAAGELFVADWQVLCFWRSCVVVAFAVS